MSTGRLEVIAGPMFSGKTEELIRRVKRAVIGKKNIQVFKHKLDTRYGKDGKVFSHNGTSFTSSIVSSPDEIVKKIDKTVDVVAIDEAQWFGEELTPVVTDLLTKGYTVIISGLALTFDRQPFPPIPTLMALADDVTKLTAVCSLCGSEAIFHKRTTSGKNGINPTEANPALVGQIESYQARCRICYDKP